MFFILSVVGTIALVFVGDDVLRRLHPAVDYADFPNAEAYYAHLKRRTRWFREEHIGWALLSGGLIASLNAWWNGGSILPLWLGMGMVLAVWSLLTHCVFRRQGHRLYDSQDLQVLGISLLSALLFAMLIGVAGGSLTVSFIVAFAVWALLFPM